MALTPQDRELLDRCINQDSDAWKEFVDRFLGLVVHTIHQTAKARGYTLSRQDVEDLAADAFAALIVKDRAALRNFRGESSLATYLAVIARRVVVRDLLRKKVLPAAETLHGDTPDDANGADVVMTRDEVDRMIGTLEGSEADIVRLFYLEGMTYEEIGARVGVPVNSIGPTLSRAKARLRKTASTSA